MLLLPIFAVAFTLFPGAHAQKRGGTRLQRRQRRSRPSANNNLAFVNNVDVGHDSIEKEDSPILDKRHLKKSKQQRDFQLGITVDKKSSKKSKPERKITKSASGKKSKGDNVFERQPTPYPTVGPGPPTPVGPGTGTPTMPPAQITLAPGSTLPPGGPNGTPTPPPLGFPTLPTAPQTLAPISSPTPQPTPGPTVPPGTPTRAPSPQPTPTPGTEASSSPTSPTDTATPLCVVGSDGLFGRRLGLAEEETEFYYEATVTPLVTATELNVDILSRVEDLMAGLILERLFDRCAPETTTRSNILLKGNLRRILQDAQTIEGWSLQPRDTVLEGAECTDTESSFPCFVIEGKATSYTNETITDETKLNVREAIRSAIELGRLGRADNRLLSVTYRDIDLNPIVTTPTLPPDNPVVRSTDENDDNGLENWTIGLIAAGGACSCLFALLFLRRSSHSALKEEDDSSSSSSSSASAKPTKEETEALTNNEPFVAPMPIYRPPINEDPPEPEFESKNKEWNVQPTPVAADRTFGAEEQGGEEDEEESESRSESESESGSEVEEESIESGSEESGSEESPPEVEDQFTAMAATGRKNPPKPQSTMTTFSQPDFNAPSFDDNDNAFGGPPSDFGEDNAFGDSAPAPVPGLTPSSGTNSSESEYSSYEEVEEEYEIEYVEEEGNLEDLEEASEDEETSWYDTNNPDQKNAVLPWLAPGDQ